MPIAERSVPDARPLPRLRRDVLIEPCGAGPSGYPDIVVTDPLRGAYFRLVWPESGIVCLWDDCRTGSELRERTESYLGLSLSEQQVEDVGGFLQANQLTEVDGQGSWRELHSKVRAGQHSVLMTLVHNYLFFRIPLINPDRKLFQLLPRVRWAYSCSTWLLFGSLALIGAYLSARQWSALEQAMRASLHVEGIALYAVVLLGLKVVHEMGHAFTSVRYGCHVPSMGIAFMLGAPVLYTDTTDTWRLAERRQRLAVVFAGVAAEILIACLAMFLWPFLPDGPLRQICFSIATASVIMSLAVNLNPLMRFDGYFALSDYLNVPNLQPRSFALAQWKLRELLFGLRQPPPEQLPKARERLLVVYAWITWAYRIALYLGIAAVVYAIGAKAIGIILALFEIIFFIILPLSRELQEWWRMRTEIRASARWWFVILVLAAVGVAFVAPWMSTVSAPAVLHSGEEIAIHTPTAAQIVRVNVRARQMVGKGEILFRLTSPELEQELVKGEVQRASVEQRLARLGASPKEIEFRAVLVSDLDKATEQVAAIKRRLSDLTIRAPISGMVIDLDHDLHEGDWCGVDRILARVVAGQSTTARGLLDDSELSRISPGAKALFVPDDISQESQWLILDTVAPAGDEIIAEPLLADINGGRVPAIERSGRLSARDSRFQITASSTALAPAQVQRGLLIINAVPTSPLALAWRQLTRVLIREQGF